MKTSDSFVLVNNPMSECPRLLEDHQQFSPETSKVILLSLEETISFPSDHQPGQKKTWLVAREWYLPWLWFLSWRQRVSAENGRRRYAFTIACPSAWKWRVRRHTPANTAAPSGANSYEAEALIPAWMSIADDTDVWRESDDGWWFSRNCFCVSCLSILQLIALVHPSPVSCRCTKHFLR